jgi:hypothetical protein
MAATAARLTALHQRAACACSSCGSLRGAPLRASARAAPLASSRRALTVTADSRKAVVVLTGSAGVSGAVTFTQEGNGASEHEAPPANQL